MAGSGAGKKGAARGGMPGRNCGPARARYWASGRLRERKMKNMLANGYTLAAASLVWQNRGRRKK